MALATESRGYVAVASRVENIFLLGDEGRKIAYRQPLDNQSSQQTVKNGCVDSEEAKRIANLEVIQCRD